ncbi:translocon-associated protein subunit delta-like [Lingula anatina]|uniref:Translocon-associated protein subunit delta n=1 Tax=Lingula anatina TaxID=7574 RepID=A0A1S3HIU9_LINAN|nr:translocon-associated protein subunit delta [Lingula anatina]XP_013400659.1 translocon-associated protein subunit delta-like [Lingula anatina]|eukprot:XP_013386033.1 translocon-associated protein subunit delta [Lingula anatina]
MATSRMVLAALAILAVLPVFTSGDTCLRPSVVSQTYTSSEAMMATETVVIVEFTLTCANNLKDVNLYAEINGRTLPATRGQNSKTYQVSWSDDHKNIPAGTYTVRFFDEDKYAALRKAQRSGDNTADIEPLFTIDVNHKGTYSGPFIQAEALATCVAILVWYLAYSTKSNLQS